MQSTPVRALLRRNKWAAGGLTMVVVLLAVTGIALAQSGPSHHPIVSSAHRSAVKTHHKTSVPRQPTTTTASTTTTVRTIAVASPPTAASPLLCSAADLTVTARPPLPEYTWGQTMQVAVQVALRTGSSCTITPAMFNPGGLNAGCFPEALAHFYDASIPNSNGLIGPFFFPCPAHSTTITSGSPATFEVSVPFQCGSLESDCPVAHYGLESWTGSVEWDGITGQNLPTFEVQVDAPAVATTTTTTTFTTTTLPQDSTTTTVP